MERWQDDTNKLIADKVIVWLMIFVIIISPLEHVISIEHILYPIVVAILMMIWLTRRTVSINLSLPLLLFIIYSFITSFWSPAEGAIGSAIRGELIYIMLFILLQFRYEDEDYDKFRVALIIQGFVMIILAAAFGSYRDLRLWISFGNTGADPNYLSAWMIMPAAVATEYIFARTTKLVIRILLTVEIVLSLFIISLSASRSGLISNVLAIILCIVYIFRKTIRRHPFVSLGLALIVAFALIYGYQNLPTTMTSRLLASTGGLGGRRYIWDQLIDALSNNWIAGFFGFGHNSVTYLNTGNNVSHNTFLDIWVQYGMIGLFLYMCFVFRVFKQSIKKDVYITNGLVSLLVLLYTLSGTTIRILIISLFMGGCTIVDATNKDVIEEK